MIGNEGWSVRWLVFACWLGCAGCAIVVETITEDLAQDLANAILDNPDIEVVRDGAPAYLILIDGLLQQSPTNVALLSQAATLNSAYAGAFVTDAKRGRVMAQKALDLASKAVCLAIKDGCYLAARPYAEFVDWVADLDEDEVPLAFVLGVSWAGWIQANSEDFNAIAELARVKALMSRMIELNEGYEFAGPHLYMGVFETLLPPALGGKPEVGRYHFERAIALSEGRHLLTKVTFAEQYGRLVFDRELHDALLREVLDAQVDQPGLTLMNAIAKHQAKELLDSADDYF